MIASIRRLGLVLLLGASLSAPCRAQDGDVLTVAVDANAPPFMYQEHDKIDGLYPLLVSAVCDRAGMACGLRALAWRRAMFELDRSAMAAAGIYKTASRAQLRLQPAAVPGARGGGLPPSASARLPRPAGSGP